MKITDMNLICMEECFEYLELKDLLNVADASTRMRRAAQSVFFQKFGKKRLKIKSGECGITHKTIVSTMEDGYIIFGRKYCLQLLRCFGNSVLSISLSGIFMSHAEQEFVLIYLNKFCAEHLTQIFSRSFDEHLFKLLENPFTKVHSVEVNFFYTFNQIGWFNKIFPNMRRLEFKERMFGYSSGLNSDHFTYHFPHLEYLDITFETAPNKSFFTCLHLNKQLKTLRLNASQFKNVIKLPVNEFRNAIESMQNLEEFTFNRLCFPDFKGNPIRLRSPRKFNLDFSIQGKPQFPFLYDNLERLKIMSGYMDEFIWNPEDFYHFLDQHPKIKILGMRKMRGRWGRLDISRLVKALPELTHIRLDRFQFSVDDVLRLVFGFKSLKTLYLSDVYCDVSCGELQSLLGNEWRLTEGKNSWVSLHVQRIDNNSAYQSKSQFDPLHAQTFWEF